MGPLVTPADPTAANGQAIGDAVRKGFITAEEIVERVGTRAQARNAAELAQSQAAVPVAQAAAMQAQEAMSPQAQAMRHQKMQMEQENDLMKQKANLWDYQMNTQMLKPALQMILSENLQPPVPDKNGAYTPEQIAEIHKMANEVAEYQKAVMPAREIKAKHLIPRQLSKKVVYSDGSSEEEITDVFDTPLGQITNEQHGKALDFAGMGLATWLAGNRPTAKSFVFGQPGQVQTGAAAPAVVQPAAPFVGRPSDNPVNKARAQLVEAGVTDAWGMSDEDVKKRMTVSAAPAVVEPALPPGTRVSSIIYPPEKKASEKAATDAQIKSATGMAKMLSANEVFENLKAANYDPSSVTNYIQDWFVGPLKFFQTDEKQSWDAAESAWMTGLLRLESGAAISEGEKSWYKKAFFPEKGNSPQVKAQKESARRDIEAIVAEVARTGNLDVSALIAAKRKVAPFTPPKPGAAAGVTPVSGTGYFTQPLPNGKTRLLMPQ